MSVTLFEPSSRVLRCFAAVDHCETELIFLLFSIPVRSRDVRLFDPGTAKPSQVKALSPYIDHSNPSIIIMKLGLGDRAKRLSTFALIAEEKSRFTQEHVHMLSLLRKPFSIAMTNALHYEKVVKLKKIVDAENRELNRELRRFSGDEIVGAEHGLKATMEMVRQVAPLNSPVP